MAQRTQLELYGLFQTGLAPSQQDFHDFIDTMFAGDNTTLQTAQAAQTAAAAAQATVSDMSGLVAQAFGIFAYSTRSDNVFGGVTVVRTVGCTATFSGKNCTVTFTAPASTANYAVILSSTLAGSLIASTPIITRTTTHFSFALPTSNVSQTTAATLDFVVFGT
jgi:hypothetical protein